MAGDAAFVEDQERVRAGQLSPAVHVPGELGEGNAGKAAVGIVQEPGAGRAEASRGRCELIGPEMAKVAGVHAEGGRLTVGEAHDAGASSGAGQGGQDGAEGE
jgi:hypothetical protein